MFRLRLSNNRFDDMNSTNSASLTHTNKLKINRSSPTTAKLSATNPTNQYGASRNSSFYLNAISKANSMCTTPTELTLPVIMNSRKKSRKTSKSSLALSATKKSSLILKADNLKEPNSNLNNTTTASSSISNNNYNNLTSNSYDNCNCVLCNSNLKKTNNYKNIFSFNSNDMYIVDSKNFINCLNRMKPTIKLDRDSNFSELGYLGSSSQTSTEFNNTNSASYSNINNSNVSKLTKIKNNNEVIKLLPASSRIKLWEPDEVSHYLNTEDAKNTLSNRTLTSMTSESPKKSSHSKETLEQSKPEIESRLNKIFKQFRLNPNLSPLIYKANHASAATISFQQVLQSPSTLNKQVMPVISKAPTTLMYRVPMNSALNFYDC